MMMVNCSLQPLSSFMVGTELIKHVVDDLNRHTKSDSVNLISLKESLRSITGKLEQSALLKELLQDLIIFHIFHRIS